MEIPFFLIPIIMIVIGFLFCFFGYSFFKFIIVLLGFFSGLILVLQMANYFNINIDKNILIIIALGIGLLLGLFTLIFYYVGVFLIGVTTVLFVIYYFRFNIDFEKQLWLVIILSITGGIVSLLFQKFMIIITTSISGSYAIINGIGYLIWIIVTKNPISFDKYLIELKKYSLELYYILFFIIMVLSVFGMIVQLKMIPKKKRDL